MHRETKKNIDQKQYQRNVCFWKIPRIFIDINMLKEITKASVKNLNQLILFVTKIPAAIPCILLTRLGTAEADYYFRSGDNPHNQFHWNITGNSSYIIDLLKKCNATLIDPNTTLRPINLSTNCVNESIEALIGSSLDISNDSTLACLKKNDSCDSSSNLGHYIGMGTLAVMLALFCIGLYRQRAQLMNDACGLRM
jgi:hypothetical protein